MTYGELNIVRTLRKKLADEEQKLSALRLCVDSITPPFTRDAKGCTCLDTLPKAAAKNSRTEILGVMISDAEARVADTRSKIEAEIPLLTEKIQREVEGEKDQALLILRYVNGKHFRDIGILLGYSEAHVYFTHRKILKALLQKNLIVDNSRC